MNYDVSLLELKLFMMTTQFGNFSEVARRQDITPSSVSRKMAQLEQKLGTKLLHRHTRAISLTEDGIAFVSHCREILNQYEQVAEQIEDQAASPQGKVVMSAPVAFGRLHIAPYLAELMVRYPRLKLELRQTDDYVDPAQDGIDLLIRIGVLPDSGLRAKHFTQQRYLIVASPSYLQCHGSPTTPGQLADYNCLVFKGNKGLQRWFIGLDALKGYEVSGSLYSNNAESLVTAAVQGAGLVMFPSWLISEQLKLGQLVPVLPTYQVSISAERQQISALYLGTDQLAPKVRVVIDFLADKYGSPCYWDQ